ncbi:MAG: substrate-binding domain-containing protein, partial [Spirochaetota bacterium]|nr:substrate-binding domain-containing protein [Spirochaetota bacterium]
CTRITGKWVFPKNLIDQWINTDAKQGIANVLEKSKNVDGAVLSAGSNDPNLDILLSYMKQSYPDFYIFTSSTGSTEGLRLLSKGYIDIAWCHLLDPKTGEYNIPYMSTYLPDMKIAVVHLFYRELGFITAPNTPFIIKDFSDLCQNGVNFINRQKGSGTRLLIDHCIHKSGVNVGEIKGYNKEVYTHVEVGLSILSGETNVGIGTVAIAKLFGLPFVPIVNESFDMVLSQNMFFNKGVQAFIDTLNTKKFRKTISQLGNYDFNESGKIIYSTSD